MSDSNDNLWKQPQQTGGWREPEDSDENPSWRRVRALPDLDEQPEQAGGWHRPDQQDTTFTPDDTLDIAVNADETDSLPEDAEAIAPEDVVASTTPVDDILPPEDMLDMVNAPETAIVPQPVLAPEDYIYQLENADDDDFDKLGMSELVALASLNQSKSDGESLSPDLALGNDASEDDINIEMLSPAERMLLKVDSSDTEEIDAQVVDDESDPAAYARRQMESLIQTGDTATDVIGEDDPTSYARRQMESLMNDTGIGSATAPIPSAPVEELSPRDVDLLRRYREAEVAVKTLREQHNAGMLRYDDFAAQLQNHMILDDDQVWWMMGVQTDQWYYADSNNQWVEGQPDVFAKEQRVNQQSYAPSQDSGSFGSLPYIPEQGVTHGEFTPEHNQYEMPLPRNVPIDDFDATVPSAAAYRMDQAASFADTVPSSAHVESTVMAQPVGYGTIESPYDQTEPPDYDYDEDGEFFEKARERARRSNLQTFSLFGALVVGLLLLVAGGYIGMAVLWYQNLANEWEEPVARLATLDQGTLFQPLVLLDRDGQQIAEISLGGDVRRPVKIEDVSPYFIHAILSLKDPNFYAEQEWTFTTRLGAYWSNVTSGTPNVQASPLTMEIARSLVLRERVYETPEERLRDELIVANELTRTYSRAELLEFYMNDVLFFGNQNYGVEAATRFYFERDNTVRTSADLTYPQGALLAVVSQSPADLDPISNREVALDQMRATMQTMAEVGCIVFDDRLPAGGQRQLCISPSDFTSGDSALNQSRVVRFLRTQLRDNTTDYPHFVTLVQNQLQAVYGDDIYRRGYRVTTTLDRSTQEHAERALIERVNLLRANGVDTGAVMVTDPRNGAILALIGSPNYEDESVGGQEDKGRTYRLPGDIIKPLVYAMAFDGIDRDGSGTFTPNEYITPASILWDVPTTFSDGTPIQNAGNAINGAIPARTALGNTLNIPVVKLFADYGGVDRFRAYAERLGIRFSSDAQIRADSALGTTEVRLYDIMKMYGVIANNGNLHQLYTVDSITDSNGNQIPVAPELKPEVERVITEEIAYLLQSILSDDAARQPRYPAGSPLTIPNARVGSISGTTPGSSDLWTVGFSTNRVVGVWLGNNSRDTVLNNLTGFQAAAPLWNEIMRNTIAGTQIGSFQRPANILQAQGCADTGTVPAGNNCPRIANIEFISSRRPPTPEQSFLLTVEVDTWSGLMANQNCSENRTTRQFVNIPDATALNWINNTQQGRAYAQRIGLPVPAVPAPTQGCDLNVVIPTANITAPQGSQTVQGDIVIYGQVSQEEFLRYEVQIAPAGTENYQTIVTSTTAQPMGNSPLATWDTSSVTNGRYTIRLAVFSNNANNGYVYRTVSDIIVNNPEPTPTPIPTATMTPIPTDPPLVIDPLPIDPLPLDPLPFEPMEGQPTPTIDPFG